MEPCSTPACKSRGMDSLPSTITLNFLLERNELVSLIMLDKKCNLDRCHVMPKAFLISKKTAAVDISLLKFRVMWCFKTRALKCHAATCMKAKLACIQQVIFFSAVL
jgi:hypothetical protein